MENLAQELLVAMEKLNAHEAEVKKGKCKILIETIKEAGGNAEMVKELDKKGLPLGIIVSGHISRDLVRSLSYFAPVYTNDWFDKPSIYFSWVNLETTVKEYDNNFFND